MPSTNLQHRTILFGIALFLGTAAFVLWQNAHVAILWDLSYLLDSSYRIALGQLPYRDFPFAHAPLTFLLQAAIIRLTGRIYFHHVIYAALAGATATLLCWRILCRLLQPVKQPRLIAALLSLSLIPLGIYSIYPHPIYDSDTILFVLLSIYLLQKSLESLAPPPILCIAAGVSLIPPLFFKQNIGLFFLAGVTLAILAIAVARRLQQQSIRDERLILIGAVLALATALTVLQFTVGLHNYLYWTITFAAKRRLPGVGLILGVYHQTSLLWTILCSLLALFLLQLKQPRPWLKPVAFLLIAAPFCYAAIVFLLADDPSDRADALLSLWPHLLLLSIFLAAYGLFRRPIVFSNLLPFIVLAAIHGTFLSQQLWGSTYALWPLLLLLIASFFVMLPNLQNLILPLTALIAATFLLCGIPYALGHDRLSYTQLSGPIERSTIPSLRGLATPGPWIPEFDELIFDTNRTIPAGDTILLFPGQDPFYYASGRTPHFPVLLFDPATNPYSPQQLAQQVVSQNVCWLIVHRNLQLAGKPLENYDDFLTVLRPLFVLDHTLTNYEIYHRR